MGLDIILAITILVSTGWIVNAVMTYRILRGRMPISGRWSRLRKAGWRCTLFSGIGLIVLPGLVRSWRILWIPGLASEIAFLYGSALWIAAWFAAKKQSAPQ